MRLHLVDGTFELFRAHYGKRPGHTTPDGRDFKATVGVVSSLLSLLEDPDERATHVAVAGVEIRDPGRLTMTIEHRAASSPPPLTLALRAESGLALHVVDPVDPGPSSATPMRPLPTDRLLAALEDAVAPMTRRQLRDACRMRSSSVGQALATLVADGLVVEDERGYAAATGVSR